MNIQDLYFSGNSVKRWHTKPTIKEQTLASHSWGVAMIVAHIYPEAGAHVLLSALTHDLHEIESGDVPYPFKKSNPVVAEIYDAQDRKYQLNNGTASLLTNYETRVLKWADMMELLMWACAEVALGNQNLLHIIQVAKSALQAMESPSPAATRLLAEYLDL